MCGFPRTTPAQFLAGLLTVLLLLPGLSLISHVMTPRVATEASRPDLTGVVAPKKVEASWTWKSWTSGAIQKTTADWFADNLGAARRVLIRLTDGIYYLAFQRTLLNSTDIIIGKQRVLYSRSYLNDACGQGPAIDLARLERALRAARRALAARHIAFAMIVSPSKPAIYPEFIPDTQCARPARRRAYEQFVPLIGAGTLPVIDGHALTVALRHSIRWPVFPRDGVHWNHLGALPTVQALIAALERQLGFPLVHVGLERVEIDDHPTGSDADLGHLLNLPFPLHPYPTAHAVFAHEGEGRPIKVLFVGSSFLWIPMEILASNGVIADSAFYSYDNRIFRINKGFQEDPKDIEQDSTVSASVDLAKRIDALDAVVLEANESFLGAAYVTRFLDEIGSLGTADTKSSASQPIGLLPPSAARPPP